MRFDVWIILDLVILFFGFYMTWSWIQMKRTGKPAKRIMERNGLIGRPCRDKEAFFEGICKPTMIAGLSSIVVGGVCLATELLKAGAVVNFLITCVFLAISFWYSNKVNTVTRDYYY